MRTRRAYLQLLASGVAGAVAGCSGGGSTTEAEPSARASATATDTSGPGERTEAETDGGNGARSISPQQRTKLAADDGRPGDSFGIVALSDRGSTAVVGAYGDDNRAGGGSGSAYVFEHTGAAETDSDWPQAAKLVAENDGANGGLGEAVAVSADGSTALVSAPFTGVRGVEEAGVAYVFTSTGGTWTQQARLSPSEPTERGRFGDAVALSADGATALVGAPGESDSRGTASVYTREGTTWGRQATLSVPTLEADMRFGRSLALADDGDVAVVGACSEAYEENRPVGRTYRFTRRGDTWSQPERLSASGADSGDMFGGNVVVNGDGTTLLVGAGQDADPNGPNSGAAYVFTRYDGAWFQEAKLTPDDGDAEDLFGWGLAIDEAGTTAVVGAHTDEDPNGKNPEYRLSGAGAAYVFVADDGDWTQAAKFAAADGDSDDGFGAWVGLSGDGSRALLGSPNDEDPNGETNAEPPSGAGSAYIFEL